MAGKGRRELEPRVGDQCRHDRLWAYEYICMEMRLSVATRYEHRKPAFVFCACPTRAQIQYGGRELLHSQHRLSTTSVMRNRQFTDREGLFGIKQIRCLKMVGFSR